jgi:hypothetical protein
VILLLPMLRQLRALRVITAVIGLNRQLRWPGSRSSAS